MLHRQNILFSLLIATASALLLAKLYNLGAQLLPTNFSPRAEIVNDAEYSYSWEQTADDDNEQKILHLQQLSAEIDRKLEQMRQTEENLQQLAELHPAGNVQYLAYLYARMPAADAARIFSDLDDGAVITLLQNMDAEKAATIIAELPADKAKSVTLHVIAKTPVAAYE